MADVQHITPSISPKRHKNSRRDLKPGERFGRLVYVEMAEPRRAAGGKPKRRAVFRCDCGNVKPYVLRDVFSGDSQSCGCARHVKFPLVGTKVEMLTFIRPAERGEYGVYRCDCGREVEILARNIGAGNKSCGCLRSVNNRFPLGSKWGKLTLMEYAGCNDRGYIGAFKCDCGKTITKDLRSVKTGETKSCGCYKNSLAPIHMRDWMKKVTPKDAALTACFNGYLRSATRRGLAFGLTKEQFERITSSDCCYCGQPPSQTIWSKTLGNGYIFNGIDRLDNTSGYTLENSAPCCKACNMMKHGMSVRGFLDHIQGIYSHSIQKRRSQRSTTRSLPLLA